MLPLSKLVNALGGVVPAKAEYSQVMIPQITADSRQVQKGALFVAISGVKQDGTKFIEDAIAKGARVILSSGEQGMRSDVIFLHHPNPRLALSQLAAAFYPIQPAHIVAVTGTDGKTSTADFTRQLWELLGYKAASMGTLGVKGEGGYELYPGTHTTPDPVALHKMLQELVEAGYTHIAMEASSHGLDQYRLHGVRIEAAAFTNLTSDHMDYHGTQEAYFAAKAKLFSEILPAGGTAVINVDDFHSSALYCIIEKKKQHGFLFGNGKKIADQAIYIRSLVPLPYGQEISLVYTKRALRVPILPIHFSIDRSVNVKIPLVGNFQIYNMLAAVGLVQGSGEQDVEKLISLLPKLKGVPGRLEYVADYNSASTFIDYAHTAAALENVLKTLRPHCKGKLHVVFGCGGDRDKTKRPEMGLAAAKFADCVVVTDDNPRSEDPATIRAEVMAGACSHTSMLKEVAGRKEAIYAAMQNLKIGDILLVAGKGHEKTQIIGNQILPFDDAETIQDIIRGKL